MATTPATYDLIIIGGGPAGYTGAIRAAQLGMRVACVESRKALGGTCLNIGCIPSKALLESSEHFYQAKTKLAKHGVVIGDLKLDLAAMMKRKDTIVRQLTNGVSGLFKKHKIDWIAGRGKLLATGATAGKRVVEVTPSSDDKADAQKLLLDAPKVLIATGSEPIELPFLKFDGKRIVSSTEALELPEVPKHLVVVGGGVIGLEMGSVWARLGARVTVIEFQDHILGPTDRQTSEELRKILTKQGIEFHLSTKCTGASQKDNIVIVETEDLGTNAKASLEADYVLVSTGRRPFTAGLGLDALGIKTDKQGRIEITDHYETSAPGIYAVGDVVIGAMLAHKAEEEAIAVVEQMAGQKGHVNYDAIPNVVYTHPELATVGASEEELKAKGVAYKAGMFPFLANGRAKGMEETEGFVKILADAKTDRVLGAAIVGPRASELIPEIVSVIEFGGSSEDIARTCHAHPTLSEVVKEAALAVEKRQLNM